MRGTAAVVATISTAPTRGAVLSHGVDPGGRRRNTGAARLGGALAVSGVWTAAVRSSARIPRLGAAVRGHQPTHRRRADRLLRAPPDVGAFRAALARSAQHPAMATRFCRRVPAERAHCDRARLR